MFIKMTIQNYIDNFVIKQKQIPYIDVLVTKGGKEVFRYFKNAENTATGKEKLYVYSCSKIVTALLTCSLIEKGIISLDDKVSKFLPCFDDAFLIKDGKSVKPDKDVTIKHLLTMSAGLDYNFETEFIIKAFEENPNSTVIDIAKAIIKSPLKFQPGEKFSYSLCHDVLGAVIEVATGEKFSSYAKMVLFEPLGMKNTTFKFDNVGFERLYYAENGKVVPFTYPEARWANHKTYESGGGGLKSTVEDLSKLFSALSLCDEKITNENTLDLLTSESTSEFSVKNSYACIQGGDYGYGLGVRVRKIPTDYGLPVGEFGWDGAAGTYGLIDRKNHISVTIGMHVRNWPDVFRGEHLKLVEMIYKKIL